MQRLVYAPKVQAWIKSDGGVVDLSPYITGCSVQRKINQVSTATVRFRNPRKMFTNWADKDGYVGPVFHPMDPIIITMTRLRGRPIQVFTGYCDTTPYFSMYPGEVNLEASCTLKRLQYSFWDPGLPFVWKFLQDYGWQIDAGRGGIVNATAEGEDLKTVNKFNDGSIANLLLGVLRDVGNWDENTIFIEELPQDIGPLVTKLFNETKDDRDKAKEGLTDFLTQIIGTGSFGGGTGSTGGNSKDFGNTQVPRTVYCVGVAMGVPDIFLLTAMCVGLQECGGPGAKTFNNCTDGQSVGWRQETSGGGYDLGKAMDVRHTATQFYQECKQFYKPGMDVATLGQKVQRAGVDTLASQMASGNPQKLLAHMKAQGCDDPSTTGANTSNAGSTGNARAGN